MTLVVATVEDLARLVQAQQSHRPFVVAIAGRDGVGTSTIANHLVMHLNDSAVVPLDDFLVTQRRLDPRVENRFDLPRVEREVLIGFTQGLPFNYRRVDRDSGDLVPIDGIIDSTLVVLEGVCAFEPPLTPYIDFFVWVDTPERVAAMHGRAHSDSRVNAIICGS